MSASSSSSSLLTNGAADSGMDLYSSSFKPNQQGFFMMQANNASRGIQKQKKMQSIARGAQTSSLVSSTTRSIKRFISNINTHKLIQKNDTVLVNVDDDIAILQSLDPQLHGKMGVIVDVRGDEIELELLPEQSNESEDDSSFDMFSALYCGSSSQPKRVTVPSFCVCLEDRVLRKRLSNA
ncbi:hypothetical protein C9374_002435 [Naegleria lovaniensis]|uniref:Uncharacterized protein n=1 Tax=Naegleria lovaniensis TaxID=51637 RepID=A0AA88GVN0_NAELO|nr:uncharacterized protein C9374_002435 [Naegleria lovaniensis]KAG2386691.1 hypothetical protein C9374_002435 [Naegleria lovaniensis]